MECLKGCDECGTIVVVEHRSLCKVPEVQKGAHCEDDTGRHSTSNHSDQILLYILLRPAGDLGQVGNTLTKMSVASRGPENGKVGVKFFGADNVDGPLDVVIPGKLMPVMKCLRCKELGGIR